MPNRARDVSAAGWLSQTCVNSNYHNFSCVVILFFSEVEIPIKHSSLCNKMVYPSLQRLNKRLAKQVTVLWNQISYLKWSTVTQIPTMQNLMNCHRIGTSGMLTMVAEWTTSIQFCTMDYMHT